MCKYDFNCEHLENSENLKHKQQTVRESLWNMTFWPPNGG